jgi:replicative DNA helicase
MENENENEIINMNRSFSKTKKELPHNESLEQQVLGAMLLDRDGLITGMAKCKKKYFYLREHQLIFQAMLGLSEENTPIDVLTVWEFLKKFNLDLHAGGPALLSRLTDSVSSSANIETHCLLLIEYWIKREILIKTDAVREQVNSGTQDAFELLEEAISDLESILDEIQFIKEERNFYERLPEVIEKIEEEQKNPTDKTLKSKEYPTFNKATGGLRPGNLVALSGAYKRGKTTFGTSLIRDFAVNSKIPVGIISLEMAEYENDLKLLSMQTGTRYAYLRDPAAKDRNGEFILSWERMHRMKMIAEEKFYQTKIFICDEPLDENQIRAKINFWVRKHGIKIIMVDYIGLVETNKKFERRDLEVSHISRTLKLIAKSTGTSMLVLSQENDDGKVAESKGLARDADFWFSISHPVDEGEKQVKIAEKYFPIDQSHFLITFKASRHSQHGGTFLCQFREDGTFVEIDVEHSN